MKLRIILFSIFLWNTVAVLAQKAYEIGEPNDVINYGYLEYYQPLKSYVDRYKYPNFKLGLALGASDYLNSSSNYRAVANNYFDEVVTGNAMKMASCVDGNGNMNFTTVTNFVNVATSAGLNVYGHTLAWHAQQATGWLNRLIKDRDPLPLVDADTTVWVVLVQKDFTQQKSVGWSSSESDYGFTKSFDSDGLKVHTTKINTNSWDVQYIVMDNIPTVKGNSYRMVIAVKGSKSGVIHSKLSDWGNGGGAEIPFTTTWQNVVVDYTAGADNAFLMFQHGDFVGDIHVKSIRIEKSESGKKATRDCIVMKATAKQKEVWDNQFWIRTSGFSQGASYTFSADIRADVPAKVSTQIHNAPTYYVDYNALGDLHFTTDWKTVTKSGYLSKSGQSIAFNLNELADANNYYFANVSFKVDGIEMIKNGSMSGPEVSSFVWKHINDENPIAAVITHDYKYVMLPQSRPLGAKEKHDTLVYAMNKWIGGIMTATGGKVKAWDVVNESVSGGDGDGDGKYDLQHGSDSNSDFFWQTHMGDLEYVRQTVRLARLHYANVMKNQDGDDGKLKLFINDYNLESDWDQNGKLKSLIKWIVAWEADGVTKIDGIGSQMHISCYMNDNTQASKKNAIANSFSLMAATGKLIRISELDMGMVDSDGNNVPTSQMTEEMHKRMANLYEWIVKKYLEIVPPTQQWGICQWCATDSPTNSGWRADTPVGLWNLNWNRKHTYAGFARGLGAPEAPTGVKLIDVNSDVAPSAIYNVYGIYMGTSIDILPSGIYIQDGSKYFKY